MYWLAPDFFWWLSPVLLGLVLAIPISVMTSRKSVGLMARRSGLFLIPEETSPQALLSDLPATDEGATLRGFARAVMDPIVNALHLRLLKRESGFTHRPWVEREQVVKKAFDQGLDSLSDREKHGLLSDAQALMQLHIHSWDEESGGKRDVHRSA